MSVKLSEDDSRETTKSPSSSHHSVKNSVNNSVNNSMSSSINNKSAKSAEKLEKLERLDILETLERSEKSQDGGFLNDFLDGFKVEWSLFWHGFLGDTPDEAALLNANSTIRKKLESMSSAEIGAVAKNWSQERQKLQLELEELQLQYDENIKKLDSLKLVGGEIEMTEEQIGKLSDQGHGLSKKIQWLAERLDEVREFKSL